MKMPLLQSQIIKIGLVSLCHWMSPLPASIYINRFLDVFSYYKKKLCLCVIFLGELLTVAPWAAASMPGLFTLNERVVMTGHWKYGFFGFAAVGAFNVGSVQITVDKVHNYQ